LTSQPPLDDPNWLKWYNQLQNDRVRRKMGLNGPEEGLMDSVDRLELMLDRGQIPEPVTFDSVRKHMGLQPLDPKTREKLGLTPE